MCLCCHSTPSDYNIPEVGPRSRIFFRFFCYWCCFLSVLSLTYQWFRPLMIIWLIEDHRKSLHYKPRRDICAGSETDLFLESASVKGFARAVHTMCVCNRLLFPGKCGGFTIWFTYNDISLSMFINQCLACGVSSSFCFKSCFWGILKETEFAVYCSKYSELSILQNRSKNRFWGKRTTI